MSVSTAEILNAAGAVAHAQLYVINLCASTSPMALSHPSAPELKRYTFFVSRQREDGRERFRLHMGYFASQQEAEALLVAVRDVYPAAWAGLAPTSGTPRRARTTPAPVMVQAPAAAPVEQAQPVLLVAAPPQPVQTSEPAPSPVLEAMSNVRDVLAQLSGAAVQRSEPPRLQPAVQPAPPNLSAAETLRVLEAPVAAGTPKEQKPAPALEASKPDAAPLVSAFAGLENEPEVRVVTPEDTQTLTDIRIDAQNNAPPCFAVQLVWSVSPIDIAALPHLAIFDAYTLYNVEGNRQGRKWYGLRLGFFSDPNSATQVANYVRADYRAVAIVPVALKERDRAGGSAAMKASVAPRLGAPAPPLKPAAQLELNKESLQGFELLADDHPPPVKRDLDDKPVAAKPAVDVAARAAVKPTGKRVVVRKRPEATQGGRAAPGAATPLESTLEILGASTLTLDESREIINDSTVRKPLNRKPAGGNRFSKLLNRLGGN